MLERDNLPLFRELTERVFEAREECPGVQYLCAEPMNGISEEYYIVGRDCDAISQEAKRYGIQFADRPDLLMYDLNDETSGRAIIEYEIRKYLVTHHLPRPNDETLSEFAEYAAELHPEYFGALLPPQITPLGKTLRWRGLINGVYLHETDQCELLISVCPPLCREDLSTYAQSIGLPAQECLLFPERDACIALFELEQSYPAPKMVKQIAWPALETAIWKYHPPYAVAHNIREQSGLNDPAGNLFATLGAEVEEQTLPENVIAISEEQKTDYLHF